jgi:hypothetical protein
VPEPLLQAFPFPSTPGEVTLHPLSQAGVFIYSSRGKWVFSPLLWSFLPTATFTSFPAPGCWACAAAPAFSCWLVYLQFREGFPLPPALVLRAPCPLCYLSFFLLLLIIQFLFFSPGWVLVHPGGYADLARGCLWEYCVLLSSPCVPRLPKPSGYWCLVMAWEPSWFLHLTWSGDALRRLEVWRSPRFASSRWFFRKVYLHVSPRFYFRRHALCFLPLATILEFPYNYFLKLTLKILCLQTYRGKLLWEKTKVRTLYSMITTKYKLPIER